MLKEVKETLSKIIKDFMWEDDSSPRIANETLTKPKAKGGLDLLDLEACNDVINIMWLKMYLNFSPTRPEWALITDLIIEASVPERLVKKAIINPFLQCWSTSIRRIDPTKMSNDIQRMMRVARKFNTNLAAI